MKTNTQKSNELTEVGTAFFIARHTLQQTRRMCLTPQEKNEYILELQKFITDLNDLCALDMPSPALETRENFISADEFIETQEPANQLESESKDNGLWKDVEGGVKVYFGKSYRSENNTPVKKSQQSSPESGTMYYPTHEHKYHTPPKRNRFSAGDVLPRCDFSSTEDRLGLSNLPEEAEHTSTFSDTSKLVNSLSAHGIFAAAVSACHVQVSPVPNESQPISAPPKNSSCCSIS